MLTPEEQEINKLEVQIETLERLLNEAEVYEEREALTTSYYLMLNQIRLLKKS